MKFYEIDHAIQQALDSLQVDEETGEIIGMEAVEALEGERDIKLLSIGKYCKGLRAEADALNDEYRELSKRCAAKERKYERLEQLIQSHIKPDQTIEDSQCVLKLRKCVPSVRILDETLLAPGFLRTTTLTTPDKKSIAEVLKNGNEVPGAELITNYSLQIK